MSALTDRNANAQTTSHPTGDNKQQVAAGVENSKMAENGQQTLGQKFSINDKYGIQGTIGTGSVKLTRNSKSVSYVSPSDAILSPASQKLAGFKQKQINKQYVLSTPDVTSTVGLTSFVKEMAIGCQLLVLSLRGRQAAVPVVDLTMWTLDKGKHSYRQSLSIITGMSRLKQIAGRSWGNILAFCWIEIHGRGKDDRM